MSAAKKFSPEQSVPSEFNSPAIFSRGWDLMFIGGLSIFVYLLMRITFREVAPDNTVAMFVFNCSFVINFPHFLVSYQLLYGDFRAEISKKFRFFWAAIMVPALIGGTLVAGFLSKSELILGWTLNVMYFFVGWHYVKQIFGSVVVTNAMKNYYYNASERMALKANLLSIWAVSFLTPNMFPQTYEQMGIHYYSLQLPHILLQIAYGTLIVSGLMVIETHLKKYIREGTKPSGTAVVSLLSIYVWFIPALAYPMFAHMIPMFHSMQYLLFVFAFRRHKVNAQAGDLQTPASRQAQVLGLWGYFALSILLGGLAFEWIPRWIDSNHLISLGPTPAVFFATVFINIHHYFIDNVIWRGDNEQIRQYLFKRAA